MSIELKETIFVDSKQIVLQFVEMKQGQPTVLKFGDHVFVREDKINGNGGNGEKKTNLVPSFVLNKDINEDDNGHEEFEKNVSIVEEKPEEKKKKKDIPPSFNNRLCGEEDILLNRKESGYNIHIYRSLVEFILDNISKNFTRDDLIEQILLFYQKKNRKISKGSAQVYSCDYRRFMLKNNIIKQDNDDDFIVVGNKDDPVPASVDDEDNGTETDKSDIDDVAPNNTAWFLNWIKNKKFFRLADFLNECHFIEEEQAMSVIRYQIKKKVLTQVSNTTFRVNKGVIKNV